jgi:hypothetical protein
MKTCMDNTVSSEIFITLEVLKPKVFHLQEEV